MQTERMRAVMKYLLPRKLAALLALPLALAAAPLCEACPVNSGMATKAPATSHSAEHACCEKKTQVRQAYTADHCDSCVARPVSANAASEFKADLQLAPASAPVLATVTPVALAAAPQPTALNPSHSPPAVYLLQQKILL
ncbi:MAG: hypothetical protein ACOY5B_06955 [Spirochaetota bacterium]